MQAIHFIETEYERIESVRDIAEHINMNYHTLRERFRRETRLRLKDFLTRTRIDKAVEQLTDSNRLIKEIAWEVGFKHEGQMIRSFRKYLNTTPQNIRTNGRIALRLKKALSLGRSLISSRTPLNNAHQI